jgi:sulfoxide reductase heme-binding subunit YedZ
MCLWPLALTSNQWALRKLKRRWGQLHRLVYLVAILVILHYFWHKSGKNDFQEVGIYAVIISSLLLLRLKK